MTKDIDYFTDQLEQQIKKNKRFKPGNTVYGSKVMPILELYKSLSSFEERKFFRDALEKFLVDSDESKRKFAVDICLGFVVFRDAI